MENLDFEKAAEVNNCYKMADRILEFLSNLLKIGKEQLILKSGILRSKVPIKPVLGLTGLGVLIMAVRPLLAKKEPRVKQIETKALSPIKEEENQQHQQHQRQQQRRQQHQHPQPQQQHDEENEYSLQKTLYLMREKEKLLRKQEAKQLQQQMS